MNAFVGARGKVAECEFFLKLLAHLEEQGSLTSEAIDNEASYFVSALLNACYSVGEHARVQGKSALRLVGSSEAKGCVTELEKDVITLRLRSPELYATGKAGELRDTPGLRHLSVHHEAVPGKHQVASIGGTWGSTAWGRTRWGSAQHCRRLYVVDPHTQAHLWIVPRMTEHVRELEELVASWERRIASLGAPGGASHLDR